MKCSLVVMAMFVALVGSLAQSAELAAPVVDSKTAEMEAKIQKLNDEVYELRVELMALTRTALDPNRMVNRVYNLEGIVSGSSLEDYYKSLVPGYVPYKHSGQLPEEYTNLVYLIEQRVAPNTWKSSTGEGTMAAFDTNRSLVVVQSLAVHEELAKYLAKLREVKRQATELGVELQLPKAK